jgi:SAM-dependent methyltransferase
LLDLGCGTKPYVEIFSSNCKGYFGMDSSGFRRPEFFVTRNGLSPDILGNICRLPFKNGSADTVLCTQVLEHLRQPDQAIAEIKQVLRSGGILIASVPQAYPLHDKTNDYYRFTSLGIRYLLEDNGFEVLDIMRHGGFFVERALMSNIYSNYNLFREGEGVGFMRLCLSLLKVVLTPALLLINAVNNISGLILNCFDPDHDFTHNYTVIARRN